LSSKQAREKEGGHHEKRASRDEHGKRDESSELVGDEHLLEMTGEAKDDQRPSEHATKDRQSYNVENGQHFEMTEMDKVMWTRVKTKGVKEKGQIGRRKKRRKGKVR